MIATLLATAATVVCHVGYSHHLPAPDNAAACTPGSFDIVTRAWRLGPCFAVCRHGHRVLMEPLA